MDYTTLGRTGLRVGVAGLGCGGFSRLGLGTGKSEANAESIVRRALELGVNLFDTAAAYGTEAVVGRAIKSVARDQVVICTKAHMPGGDGAAKAVVDSLDKSLRELGTDHIDVFQLHGVPPADYDRALTAIVPVLLKEKAKGKLRFLGIQDLLATPAAHRDRGGARGRGCGADLARRGRSTARLPDPSGRCRQPAGRRLPHRAPRARGRRRAVRHRRSGPSRDQSRLAAEAAAARRRPRPARRAVRSPDRHRARPARPHQQAARTDRGEAQLARAPSFPPSPFPRGVRRVGPFPLPHCDALRERVASHPASRVRV
ncbi:MAG: aldo/keto reductase [Proteobacteria bacterium]|nr:aldo/keto reductase [Pseudomonadota bacterium]